VLDRDIVETVRESLIVVDGSLNVLDANRSFTRFKVALSETVGRKLYDLGDRA
jgi:hypothetical protein